MPPDEGYGCRVSHTRWIFIRPADGFVAGRRAGSDRSGGRGRVRAVLTSHADQTDAAGHRRLVRHGHLPKRGVQTGIGAVPVKVPVRVPVKMPRVRDRAPEGGRLKFTSTILPPCLRRARLIGDLLPWLYKGISTDDFSEALAALLGPDAPSLSATTITRQKADWWDDYERWSKRDLSARRYVYFWADGVCFTPRMDKDRQCMLVSIGADEWGNKDVPGLIDGFRESTRSWRELPLDLKPRGLEAAPKLAVGDGAMGFRAALHEVYGNTRVQRCWVHKTANVLNALPKSVQPKAKAHLKDIWMAETKAGANAAIDFFVEA